TAKKRSLRSKRGIPSTSSREGSEMPMRRFRPTSPARRYYESADFSELSPKKPERHLTEFKSSKAGRNSQGRVTVRFRGGGHRRRYRRIDLRRNKVGVPAKVVAIEYDPNRSARIALLHYEDGEKAYVLAPEGLFVGAKVVSSRNADIQPGNAMALRHIPLGTL